jgi:hypothetical protein
MKNRIKIMALTCLMLTGCVIYSQSDSLGMPGDNLDLNAVLSIFKQSSNTEDFEKRLNSADTKINNLDLNNDQQVDYLRVIDYGKGDYHSIVIQDPISKSESQDVAVIEIQKKGDKTAHIQIVGDETLYGKNYIIEPTDQPQTQASNNNTSNDDVYNGGYRSSNSSQNRQMQTNNQGNRPVSTERINRGSSNHINASRQMQSGMGERRMSNPNHVNFGDGGRARMSGGSSHMGGFGGGGFGGGGHMGGFGGGGGGHMGGGHMGGGGHR